MWVPGVPFYLRLNDHEGGDAVDTFLSSSPRRAAMSARWPVGPALSDDLFPRSYAALWCRDAHAVYAGKAVLEKGFLRLTGADRRGCESRESLALSGLDVVRVARGRHERLEGRPVLVLTASGGPSLRLALLDGGGTLLELAERLTRMKAGASVAG
jgi:hypothetical protein